MAAKPTPFGRLLRAERKRARFSQAELGKLVGLSHAYLGEVERGARGPFPARYWPALVKALPSLTLAEIERAAAQSQPLAIDLSRTTPEQAELALALAMRIRGGDLGADECARLVESLAAGGDARVRAHGRVLDRDGTPLPGRAFVYRVSRTRGWSAVLGARAHAGRNVTPLDGRVATLLVAKPVDLLTSKDPRGAGFFDVPGGLAPGDYALDVHLPDGRQCWAWPFTVSDGHHPQDVRIVAAAVDADGNTPAISTDPEPPPAPLPGNLPPVAPLARHFTPGTFTLAFSYYGLGGAPRERIARDLDRFRAAGFGHARVWVDWERPSTKSRIVDRKGALILAQAEKLDWALDHAAALGLSVDLTLETAHYDAIQKSAEGYDITHHKKALRAVLTRWGQHPAVRIVDVDNEAEVRGAGGHGSPDTGHTSPARFADLMSVARSVPRSCLVGASVSFSIDGLPKDYLNLFRDTKPEILLPHFPRVKGWGAAEGPNAKTLARAIPGLAIYHQEPARNGHSTSPPGGWPVSEFEASFKSARAAGSVGCCFHTGAAFDLTAKDAWDQLDKTEREVIAHIREWVR
ncbi:MAG: helix-turn-helix domain-containing protein [Deltaproteobacteria bacterium]|jgi:transcriptional regulator with XRE-family HTH domain|nr:helix-turn-helix domain-containing protein [Deltaproteobacteria bacterium]